MLGVSGYIVCVFVSVVFFVTAFVLVFVFSYNFLVLTRTKEVDSTDSVNRNVRIQITGQNINTQLHTFIFEYLSS